MAERKENSGSSQLSSLLNVKKSSEPRTPISSKIKVKTFEKLAILMEILGTNINAFMEDYAERSVGNNEQAIEDFERAKRKAAQSIKLD